VEEKYMQKNLHWNQVVNWRSFPWKLPYPQPTTSTQMERFKPMQKNLQTQSPNDFQGKFLMNVYDFQQ
jgi:hypothetical protein